MIDPRFEVRCNLEYGWHIVDLASRNLVIDEFGQYQDEAVDFCRVLNEMWRECDLSYACPDIPERFRHRTQ